jgi:ribosome-associated translation inhibitor RaiA
MTEDVADLPVVQVTRGPVSPSMASRAEDVVRTVASRAPRPVIFARVKLISEEGHDGDEQAVAEATLDVSGRLVRAQSAARTMNAAVDGMADRLDRQLRRVAERLETRRGRPPQTPEGGWRHGDLPRFPHPDQGRRVVHNRTYGPETASIDEALFDLEVLDYHFLLFTDAADMVDSIVYQVEDGVALRRADGRRPGRRLPDELGWNPAPTADLEIEGAVDRLDTSAEPFVFFSVPASRRAQVLYRRYDGHYGLIKPLEA